MTKPLKKWRDKGAKKMGDHSKGNLVKGFIEIFAKPGAPKGHT
jgi:hypothetical protein